MPICAIQLPVVRIFEDFDKMSAQDQQFAAMDTEDINDDGDVNNTNDRKCIIKYFDANMEQKDGSISSNEEDSVASPKPLRQRKRSTPNTPYKMSKAFSESHSTCNECNLNNFHHDCSAKRMNTTGASSSSGCNLRKQILIRRSPSPSIQDRSNSQARRQLSRLFSVGLSAGYAQYQKALLEVPLPRDYGDASSDDLSSEWDSDVQETQRSPKVFIAILLINFSFYLKRRKKKHFQIDYMRGFYTAFSKITFSPFFFLSNLMFFVLI